MIPKPSLSFAGPREYRWLGQAEHVKMCPTKAFGWATAFQNLHGPGRPRHRRGQIAVGTYAVMDAKSRGARGRWAPGHRTPSST